MKSIREFINIIFHGSAKLKKKCPSSKLPQNTEILNQFCDY